MLRGIARRNAVCSQQGTLGSSCWVMPHLFSAVAFDGLVPALFLLKNTGEEAVPRSVLDAIRMGIWDFEPDDMECEEFDATCAMPGTPEKIEILAARAREGLPLWHDEDRTEYDEGA